MSTSEKRSALDAATEITIAAIAAGGFEPDQAVEEFQKDVVEFFDAIYKQAWQNTHLAKYPLDND